jgi:tetratricopeptide (TPR) repeat protein
MPRRPSDHVDDPKAVGRRLREARQRAGLSQRDLAFPGCTTAYISRIEAGVRIPSLQVLMRLADRLDVSAEFLATGRDAPVIDPIQTAELALRFDDPHTAREAFREIAETASDDRTRARAIAGLGHVAFEAGDHEQAIELFEQALELTPSLEEDAGLADSLGRAYAFTSRFDEAIALFERRLAVAEERQDLMETLRFSVLLANTLADRGRIGRAEELLGHALALADSSRDPLMRARIWWAQSRLHVLKNDPARAERYARLALDTLAMTDHTRYLAVAHQVLALIKLDQGEPGEALELIETGMPLVLEGGNGYERGIFLVERARALSDLGQLDDAEAAATEAMTLLDGSRGDAMRALAVLADIHEHRGETEEAISAYRAAVAAPELTSRYRVETLTKLGEALRRDGRTDEALDVFAQALKYQAEATAALD